MRKLLVTLFASLLLTACAPEVPAAPGTTTTVVTTPACTPRATGGDDTANVTQIMNNCQFTQIIEPLRIDKQIVVTGSGKTVQFYGNGKLYRSVPAPDGSGLAMLRFTGSSNVTLNNPVIQGPNARQQFSPPGSRPVCGYWTPLENQHLLAIRNVHNFTVNNGKLTDGNGDGVYIDGGSTGVTLNNLTVDCVGRTAVTNLGSSGTRINGGTFTTTVWWIFNIELQGETVSNYYIDKPTIGYSRLNFLLASCPYGGSYTGVVVNKPVFLEGARQIYTSRCGDVTVNY